MAQILKVTIDEFVRSDWDEMIVYTLSQNQKDELMNNQAVTKKEYRSPKGYVYETHQHETPQLILVVKGELTHVAEGNKYVQNPNDLLVVPANLPHHGYVGKEELVVYAFNKKKP